MIRRDEEMTLEASASFYSEMPPGLAARSESPIRSPIRRGFTLSTLRTWGAKRFDSSRSCRLVYTRVLPFLACGVSQESSLGACLAERREVQERGGIQEGGKSAGWRGGGDRGSLAKMWSQFSEWRVERCFELVSGDAQLSFKKQHFGS